MAGSRGRRRISPRSFAAISPDTSAGSVEAEAGGSAPERTLYGRRKGKPLRALGARLVTERLPGLSVDVSQSIDATQLFARSVAELRLEIGFGGGEHLAREAAAHPETGFIGCEPFLNGVAKLLGEIETRNLQNVRIHMGDARDILRQLPSGCLARVDILYPDPWPKRRQRKRRFIGPETLAAVADRLQPGGILRFASDIDDYTGWTLAHALREPRLRWRANRATDWRSSWDDWEPTRYEQKAVREGRDACYLTFQRLPS